MTAGRGRRTLARGARLVAALAFACSSLWLSVVVPALPGAEIPAVAAATVRVGGVVAWGSDVSGQTDVPEEARSGVISVAAGCSHSLALKSTGKVVAWGDDTYGQTDVPPAAQSGVAFISAGCVHSVAMKKDGSLVAWGDNSYGQLVVPRLPRPRTWVNFGTGARHNVAVVDTRRELAVWGDSSDSQMSLPPILAGALGTVPRISQVEAGGDNSIVRFVNGTVVVWGGGPPSVLAAPALSDITNVAMGYEHVLAMRKNGRVVAWGEDGSGQTNVPAGLTKVIAISAGRAHSLALRSDDRIVAWGANDFGQVTVPALPPGGRFIAIAAGGAHSLAVMQSPPDAPTGVIATPLEGEAAVHWTAPAHDGGYGIRGYTVKSSPEGKTCATTGATAGATSCTVRGLKNGVAYTFTVTAANALGASPASLPSQAVVPGAPATPSPSPSPSPVASASATAPAPSPTATPSGAGGAGGWPAAAAFVAAVALVTAIAALAVWLAGRWWLRRKAGAGTGT